MGTQNSQWFIDLSEQIIVDMYALATGLFLRQLPTPRSRTLERERERDIAYLKKRAIAEGLTFFTSTMPKFGKYVDEVVGMKAGVPPLGFKPYLKDGRPRFLHMIVELVVSPSEEDLHADRARLLRAVRTLCFLCYKLEVPYTREQERSVLRAFVENDESLSDFDPYNYRLEYMRQLIDELLDGFAIRDSIGRVVDEVIPRHGPGAVATGEKLEEKWVFTHLYSSLHQRFPYYEFMYGCRQDGTPMMLLDQLSRYRSMIREDSPTAKVVLVPKDSRGPRLISAEPLEVQYIQQGVARVLMNHLERNSCYRGQINFTSQEVNRDLAREGSRTTNLATIDLSEASDRVSKQLVNTVFSSDLAKDLIALRSTHTKLPRWFVEEEHCSSTLELEKYAPMGSALCFPIESIIFWAVSVVSIYLNSTRNYDSWRCAARSVYVYGDDIIIPANMVGPVTSGLESIGLKVNGTKSYWEGNFRESCGFDGYYGHFVSPIRLKKFPPINVRQGCQALAYASYCSQFWEAGLTGASDYVYRHLINVFGFVPVVRHDQSYLSIRRPGFETEVREYPRLTTKSDGSYPRARCWRLSAPKRSCTLDSWERLNRFKSEPRLEDTDSVVVPNATKIQLKSCQIWVDGLGMA